MVDILQNDMPKQLLDTNLLLRLLIGDNISRAKAVASLLENAESPLVVTDLAFAELVWTMSTFYKFPKAKIIEKLLTILNFQTLELNRSLLIDTFTIYSSYNIDFIDAYHVALMKRESITIIYSYDRDFDKIKDIKRIEPS